MDKEALRVLIVDDNVNILKMLKKILESRGWTVFTAPTGNTAVSTIEGTALDLVLLDINLPDSSGLEVLKQIKPKYPNLPVIMITGFGYEDKLVTEALRLGAAGYVSKGVPLKELIEVINNILAL